MLDKDYLLKITGGGYGFLAIIGGALSFIIGVIDGYLRPLKCN